MSEYGVPGIISIPVSLNAALKHGMIRKSLQMALSSSEIRAQTFLKDVCMQNKNITAAKTPVVYSPVVDTVKATKFSV